MAAKKTSELIPMCHPLNITKAKVECAPVREGEREDGRVAVSYTHLFVHQPMEPAYHALSPEEQPRGALAQAAEKRLSLIHI